MNYYDSSLNGGVIFLAFKYVWISLLRQAIFIILQSRGYLELCMKVVRILIVAIICALLASLPAQAWSWPIFGFGPGPGAPLAKGPLPSSILPGTFEWALQPACPARLVLPGYSYGIDAFQGNVVFGLIPSFGCPTISLTGGPGFGNIGK